MTYQIKHKDGTLVSAVKKVVYNDNFMGESVVSVDIKSPVVIPFAIGDYIDYKGRRFYLANTPSVSKSARRQTAGDAFVYESVKLVDAAGYDLTRCKFRDVVLKALESAYHTNFAATNFAIYCESLITFGERLKANLDRLFAGDDAWTVKVRLSDGTNHICDGYNSQDHALAMGEKGVSVSISNQTCWDALGHVKDDFGVNFILADKVVGGKNKKEIILGANGTVLPYFFRYGKGNGVFKFDRTVDESQAIITMMRAYGNTTNMPIRYYNKKEGSLVGETINVQNLMLPGFGVMSLHDIVEAKFGVDNSLTSRIRAIVSKRYGVSPRNFAELNEYVRFSSEAIDPYIIAVPQAEAYGVREGEVTFDGSGDYIDIHPSLEWMGDSNQLVDAEQITDNGAGVGDDNIPEKENFYVVVKLGFNPKDYISFGKTSFNVSMRSGMCGGRSFECFRVEEMGDDKYKLYLKRVEEFNLWFPYSDFNLKAGDTFVLTDIDMPEEYVEATALQELLPQAIAALLDNCDTRYKYSIDVDNIAMARQHDAAETPEESIYNTIAAGCEIWFGDEDLDFNFNANTQTVTGHVLIDKVEIKEEDGGIPKYSITLVDEVSVGTLEAIQKKVDAITSGKITINGTGGGGGGYTETDIQNICRALGDARYLRLTGGTVSGGVGIVGNFNVRGNANVEGTLHATKFAVDSIEVMEAKHISGKVISSPASAEIAHVVVPRQAIYFDLLFECKDADGRDVNNMFAVDDMIWCEQYYVDYDGKYKQNRVYWRRVEAVGKTEYEGKEYNYVRVASLTSVGSSYSDMPMVGDIIVVLGNLTDKDRQNATISSPVGQFAYKGKNYNAPYECQYVSIGQNGFKMPDPVNVKSPSLTVINADEINLSSGGTIGGQDQWDIYSVDWEAEVDYDDEGHAMLRNETLEPESVDVSEDWVEADYPNHIGDYIVTKNGYCYRFVLGDGNAYYWEIIEDELLLDLQSKLNGLQQSGIRTEKDFAEMFSRVISTDDGKSILAEAGVMTSTTFDDEIGKWWSGVDIWADEIQFRAGKTFNLKTGEFVVTGDNFSVDKDGRVTALNGRFKGIQVASPNYVDDRNFEDEMFVRTDDTIDGITKRSYDYDFVDRGNILVLEGDLASILKDDNNVYVDLYIQLPGSGSAPWSKYDQFTCLQLIGKRFYIFNKSNSSGIGVNNGAISYPITPGYYGIFELIKDENGRFLWAVVSRGRIDEFTISDV